MVEIQLIDRRRGCADFSRFPDCVRIAIPLGVGEA
jgi:hypothetical protein